MLTKIKLFESKIKIEGDGVLLIRTSLIKSLALIKNHLNFGCLYLISILFSPLKTKKKSFDLFTSDNKIKTLRISQVKGISNHLCHEFYISYFSKKKEIKPNKSSKFWKFIYWKDRCYVSSKEFKLFPPFNIFERFLIAQEYSQENWKLWKPPKKMFSSDSTKIDFLLSPFLLLLL